MERDFKNLRVGQMIDVQAYKFNGFLYRQWNSAKVIFNNSRHIVLFLCNTKVSDYNKKINHWKYTEHALWFFPKNSYFNAILLLKQNAGIYHYMNIASKPIFEDQTLKFIDFDLDIKCYPEKDLQIVDRDEFLRNIVQMKYPKKLKKIVFEEVKNIFSLYTDYKYFFNPEILIYYLDILLADKLIDKKFHDKFIINNIQKYSDEFNMFSDLMKK
ncbi:DUF402 domain-containing protein [Mycoplasmopsis citelli]|uniref:Protein of uncharacterized function (DUF402) n=1 Tax=Mycoplasmopsis citelli TaxID=171281 RepID=A0A449B291_9BACT|nr:DUF402 domain-containing protein [Mycoplasmopsis citelli]UUD36094.1 DUF402 domain-containing protein [Mycoplasmopsis citelli]VEU74644.1 Protein of uncharacterised function (DUF402) [Mycoplasmopsis citelli]